MTTVPDGYGDPQAVARMVMGLISGLRVQWLREPEEMPQHPPTRAPGNGSTHMADLPGRRGAVAVTMRSWRRR